MTQFFNPMKKKSVRWRYCQSENDGPWVLCLTILVEISSSRTVFNLNYHKSGVNGHLRFCQFKKKTRKCAVLGAYYSLNHGTTHCIFQSKIWTHTRHISEFWGNLQNRRCLFTPDLLLFKSNTARDEGIHANSQTQH